MCSHPILAESPQKCLPASPTSLPSPPSPSHVLALMPHRAQKGRSKKAFSTLCKILSRVLLTSRMSKELVPAAAPSQVWPTFPIRPTVCGLGLGGRGKASPEVFSQRAGPQRWLWISEKGKPAGALACAQAAGSHCENTCARWEGGLRDSVVCNVRRGKGLPLRHAAA